jgi:hypothetical protein
MTGAAWLTLGRAKQGNGQPESSISLSSPHSAHVYRVCGVRLRTPGSRPVQVFPIASFGIS